MGRNRYRRRYRKRQQSKIGKHLLGLSVVLLMLAVLSAPVSPAVALPAKGEQQEEKLPKEKLEIHRMPEEPVEEEPVQVKPIQDAPTKAPAPAVPAVSSQEVPAVSAAVADTYFADTVFLGDSRTEGFSLYSGLKGPRYLFSVGATVDSVFKKPTEQTARGKVPMMDALRGMECGKVYVMLGVNELGWPRAEKFKEYYGKIIDQVRADHPQAQVVIQSILPVSSQQEAKKSYVNNKRIAEFNEQLKLLAEEKNCPYLNVAEAVSDENGFLRAEWTVDGVHLNPLGIQQWLNYLRFHPLPGTALPMG